MKLPDDITITKWKMSESPDWKVKDEKISNNLTKLFNELCIYLELDNVEIIISDINESDENGCHYVFGLRKGELKSDLLNSSLDLKYLMEEAEISEYGMIKVEA